MTQSKTLVMSDFWIPNSRFPDSNLYSDQIGWTTELKVESGGYADPKEVWEHLIAFPGKELVGFDLGFLYLGDKSFYYLDNMDEVVYKVPLNKEWDGKYLMGKFQFPNFDKIEADDAFVFDHPSQVWDSFKINGKSMEHILSHSVLFLGT